jgi:ABC-type multidrug transport system fused ATPase/permease subunit
LFRLPDSTQSGELKPDRIEGLIEMKDVDFVYPTRPNEPVLQKLCLKLEPGKILAIVGPSGSGKSTVAALLTRLYDPTNGEIYLDGHPLKKINPQWLRQHIGVVPQVQLIKSSKSTKSMSKIIII